jgi:hypothetical protein
VSHSLYFLTATLLAGQAGDARPMPQAGAPVVVESAPIYVDGQGQAGNYQPQRRGLFARIGGWFGGVFGRNRQSAPTYDNNPQIINGQLINGRPINGQIIQQQPLNTNEPPLPGKTTTVVPQQSSMAPAAAAAIAQVSHGPSNAALDLPVVEKFKNKVGHEADYSWLTGQLYRLEGGNGALWVVRYATAEERDAHGGSVLLAPSIDMRNFRDGDLVSVKGQVLNGGRHSEQIACPVYRAEDVNLLERGD